MQAGNLKKKKRKKKKARYIDPYLFSVLFVALTKISVIH